MSRSALAACIRHLHGKMAAQQHSENSDEQLLHAFAEQRDQSAFAALVHRHGPMVLHVCRRVLGHEQDAEDAFQATFLVLARRAAMLRKKASVVSFLHGIAYRTALKAKQSAARRRKHEGQAPSRSPANPVEELSWREVRELLDEEIARLPEIYRSVFILCVLEEQSRAEAAQRLGLNENTLSSRLAKARKRLGQRLARRGVELTAVLAASTVATQSASALPAMLASTTIQAALGDGTAGLISAHIASLVKSAAAPAPMSKIVICLALVAGAVAVGAGVLVHQESPAPPAEAPRAEAPKAADKKPGDSITVRGCVLDPGGKPVKDARLYWPHWPNPEPKSEEDIAFPLRAKTDADGRFRFELPRSDIRPEFPLPLLAAADGYGTDWAELPKGDAPAELTLRLVKDQPIEGRIISTEGKPLAGVRVRALIASKMSAKQLDDFLAEWKRNWQRVHGQQKAPQAMLLPREEKSFQAVTDKDGRFRIRGAGAERVVLLRLRGAGVPADTLSVISRAGFDAAPINKIALERTSAEERRLRHPPLLYGPKIEYVAATGRRIEGTVRELGTGKAVPGFVIGCSVGEGGGARVIADKEGRYSLENLPKAKLYLLHASPPPNSSWLPMSANVDDTTGVQPLRVDFTVARGVSVSGRVIDKSTGKGIRGLVRFAALPGNPFFEKPGHDAYRRQRPTISTDAEGSFRLAVFPGPGVLMVQAGVAEKANGHRLNPYKQAEFDAKDHKRLNITKDSESFTVADNTVEFLGMEHAVKLLDLTADAGPAQCDLLVDRGATRTLRIEDADGKPLKGTTVAGVTATARTTFPISDATCTIFALDPKKPRRLLFLHAPRRLAGTLTLRGDEKEPVIVRLGQAGAVTGRVLGADGQALAGADVNLILSEQTGFALYREARSHPTARTDMDGRFRLEGIVPEVKFTLGIVKGRTVFTIEPHIGVKQVKPGETLDVGDIRVKPGP